jgi:hypothetical protein
VDKNIQAKIRQSKEPRVSMQFQRKLQLYNMLPVADTASRGDLRRKCEPLIMG